MVVVEEEGRGRRRRQRRRRRREGVRRVEGGAGADEGVTLVDRRHVHAHQPRTHRCTRVTCEY
eukprot:272673-Rhodomonas_salina.2